MMKLTESQARKVGSKIHEQMHGEQLNRFVSADMLRMIRSLSREMERLQTEIRFLRGQ